MVAGQTTPHRRIIISMRYPVPAADGLNPSAATIEIKKSRFIGWCARTATADDAAALLALARSRYPDASHHCSAFIAGPPGSDHAIGFSDDGEPGGTAGRPMLAVLDGAGIGEIGCVVTRYFGGTKLGTGGLARAYAKSVSAVLAGMTTQLFVPRVRHVLETGFGDEPMVRTWLAAHEGLVADARYHEQGVTFDIDWPRDATADFSELDGRLGGRLIQHTAQ